MAEELGRIVLVPPIGEIEVPIFALDRLGDAAVGAERDPHIMSRRDRLHALEHGAPSAEREEGEEMVEPARIGPRRDGSGSDQRLDLGAEIEAVALPRNEQGTDPHAIARKQHDATAQVDQRKSELALQAVDELLAVLLIEMHDHFGIGARCEDVPLRFQVEPQLGVLEQLPVADHRDRAIFVEDGLLSIVETDNAETAMGKTDAGRDEEAVIVGPAVPQRICHALQHRPLRAPAAPKIDQTS